MKFYQATPFEKHLATRAKTEAIHDVRRPFISGITFVDASDGEARVEAEPFPKDTPCYRRFRSVDRHFYDKGAFLLTTLRQMARKEELGPLWDPQEGSAGVILNGLYERGDDELVDSFISVGASGIVTEKVQVEKWVEDCWVLCLTESMDAEVNAEEYDDGISIYDIWTLAHSIQAASGGRLGDPKVCRVVYKPRRWKPGEVPGPPASPFVKDTRFSPEQEIRVVWPALVPSAQGTLSVTVPDASRLFASI